MQLKKALVILLVKLNALSLRERLIFMFTVIAVLGFSFDSLVFTRFSQQGIQIEQQIASLNTEINRFESTAREVFSSRNNDKNRKLRADLQSLDTQINNLETEFTKLTDILVDPRKMNLVLSGVLQKHSQIELVSVKSLPVESLDEDISRSEYDESLRFRRNRDVYLHGMEIVLEGSYADILIYLEELEKSPWQLYWASLKYEVLQYPKGKLTLKVHTLSTDKRWIGV